MGNVGLLSIACNRTKKGHPMRHPILSAIHYLQWFVLPQYPRYSVLTKMQKAKGATLAFAPEPFPARGGSDQTIFTTHVGVCHDLRMDRLVFCNVLTDKDLHHAISNLLSAGRSLWHPVALAPCGLEWKNNRKRRGIPQQGRLRPCCQFGDGHQPTDTLCRRDLIKTHK